MIACHQTFEAMVKPLDRVVGARGTVVCSTVHIPEL